MASTKSNTKRKHRSGIVASTAENAETQVAYLLGAGATHAELLAVSDSNSTEGAFLEKNSLLLAEVSRRVCRLAWRRGDFKEPIKQLLASGALTNIELFISLLEENEVEATAKIVRRLKERIETDITEIIEPLRSSFYLHKALFEFHKKTSLERVVGVISLNYDYLADDAYRLVWGAEPDYCFSAQSATKASFPLLKLHGGFDLQYRKERLPIVTPGINKNYLALPYSFIWGRALEVLIECDVLRVIGCSLSTNDVGIIDLLFKAHLIRGRPFTLQLIDFDPEDNRIKEHFGFFPEIQTATEIEKKLIGDITIRYRNKGVNPFKIWLRAKLKQMLDDRIIERTHYVKKVLD